MGYSDNVVTLQRRLAEIQPLLEGANPVVWRTRPGKARGHAFRMWEAIRLARANGYSFPEYKISVLGLSEVQATIKENAEVEIVEVGARSGNAAFVDTRQVSVVGWLEEVQQIWAQRGPAQKVVLPKAWLDRSQLEELFMWAQGAGVIFFEHEGVLTLMELEGNEALASYSWSPMDDD